MSKFRLIPYAVLTAGGLLVGERRVTRNRCTTIDQRQDYQQDRIEHGIRDGQITSSEAASPRAGRAGDRSCAGARLADGV